MPDEKKARGQPKGPAVETKQFVRDVGGWRTEEVTVQCRGIRQSVGVKYYDNAGNLDLQLTAASARLNSDPISFYVALRDQADAFLKSRGEKGYLEALEEFACEFEGEAPPVELGAFALSVWASDIGHRHGVVSAEAIAAQFLMLADTVCMSAGSDEKRLQETFAFARAWHQWQAEVDGEHVGAAQAVNAKANLQKAAPVRAAKKADRLLIVKEEAEKLWQERPNYRLKRDSTAGTILGAVNRRFKEGNLGSYTVATLTRAIGEVYKK